MSRPPVVHWLLLGLVVVLPSVAGEWVADHVGTRAGAGLAHVIAGMRALGPERAREWVVLEELQERVEPEPSDESKRLERSPLQSRERGAPAAPPLHGLRVDAQTVLRIANSGAQPVGIPVSRQSDRPAGILLTNVGALGIGLVDGDILVSAAGSPATEVGSVVSRIISARGAKASVIVGEIWRSGEVFPIAVEQPYLPAREALPDLPAPPSTSIHDGGRAIGGSSG